MQSQNPRCHCNGCLPEHNYQNHFEFKWVSCEIVELASNSLNIFSTVKSLEWYRHLKMERRRKFGQTSKHTRLCGQQSEQGEKIRRHCIPCSVGHHFLPSVSLATKCHYQKRGNIPFESRFNSHTVDDTATIIVVMWVTCICISLYTKTPITKKNLMILMILLISARGTSSIEIFAFWLDESWPTPAKGSKCL